MIKQKWECHKTVEAFQIIGVDAAGGTPPPAEGQEAEPDPLDGASHLVLNGINGQSETVTRAWFLKHMHQGMLHPSSLIGGYAVRYADGYFSWSPRAAFEQGYTELKDENTAS